MKSFDFKAVVFENEVYCNECLPKGLSINDERVSPIFADSEWGCPPVCYKCKYEHTYMTIIEER